MAIKFGSLFSGIGGFDLGLERAGMQCEWQVEIDQFCQKVLEKHWPDVKRYFDVRDCGQHNLTKVDLICGGFPCQDISNAGKRVGIDGERSGLWSEFHRIICELRPRYVLVENVAALLVRGMDRVLSDLAASGYDAEWDVLPAGAFGANHLRKRIFVVAYPGGERMEGQGKNVNARIFGSRFSTFSETVLQNRVEAWIVDQFRDGAHKPLLRGDANGLPDWVDRTRAIGNAVVPQIAEWIGKQIMSQEV